MTICVTTNGKQFILERCRHIAYLRPNNFFLTAAGNVVRLTDAGVWSEVSMTVVEANILLLPYEIAFELFPSNPVFNETV